MLTVLLDALIGHAGAGHPEAAFWKSSRTSHGAPSQMSSVDEGVADMDSSWDPDPTGSSVSGVGPGSSMSSGIGQSIASSGPRSRADWKWPTRGSTGSSVQISSDLSQVGIVGQLGSRDGFTKDDMYLDV